MTTRKRTHKTNLASGKPIRRLIAFEKDDDYVFSYSNIVQVLHTSYDFQLTFGLIDAVQGPGKPKVKGVATIALAPAHAKKLADVLNKNIARYEAEFMELPMERLEKKEKEDAESADEDEAIHLSIDDGALAS